MRSDLAGAVVSDDRALQAMELAFSHLRIVLEPGGAVALAAALFGEGIGLMLFSQATTLSLAIPLMITFAMFMIMLL